LLCSRLDLPGGTERASVNLANLLAGEGHAVTVYILDETANRFFPLQEGIQMIHLPLHFGITPSGNKWSRKADLFRHVRKLRKSLLDRKPQIIIGTEYHLSIAAYMAAPKKGTKVLGWEHHHIHWLEKNRFWNFLWKRIYPRLHGVVCLNRREAALFAQMHCRSVVIPLVVAQQEARAKLEEAQLLTIGWLIRRKGIDLIPRIGEIVFRKHPGWKWKIIGSGELREAFLKEIKYRGIEQHFILEAPGQHDLQQTYLRTSIYVMPSRFECLPMVLLEAASFGVPGVAFDCPTGPADILQHGKTGYLVLQDDVEAMAAAIIDLIDHMPQRVLMGGAARAASRNFSPERIYGLWKALFDGLMERKK